MPILNYTTKIDSAKSIAEIQKLLAAKGAKSISSHFENGQLLGLYFSFEVNKELLNFKLPCKWEGVLSCLKTDRKCEPRYRTAEQAQKITWRIIKDWVEAQVALIEAGQAKMGEVFMPYAVTNNGQTFFQRLESNPQLLLGV